MSKLLVVIGSLEDEDHIKRVVGSVVSGINEWLRPFPVDDQEEICQILNSIPSMKSIPNRNAEDVVSRFRGRILDTTLLINPTLENLHCELIDLLLTASSKCLVAFGGFASEEKGDWILQDGLFSFNNIQHILKDSKVVAAVTEKHIKFTISCCKYGLWKSEEMSDIDRTIHLEVLDASTHKQNSQSDASRHNVDEFMSFLEEGIGNEIGGVFSTLKPPRQEGFLKIRNPCLYIFPGGHGDSAFFAVNGFNMLVNGGSNSKPWFWKLIQHVDRVDSILATHLGADNLPGINSLLLRKLQEKQVKLPMDSSTEEYQALRRCLISPDMGPLFINAPNKFLEMITKNPSPRKDMPKLDVKDSLDLDDAQNQPMLKTSDIVKDTLRLSKALNMELSSPVRKPGNNDPITLFSKIGLGRLDMYVLNPVEGSKELNYMNDKWGCDGRTNIPAGKTGITDSDGNDRTSSLDNLSSICFLLVWHPSDPNEKIVRVLFPGNTSQTKIFEGLEGIKDLPFMKVQFATANSIKKQKQSVKSNGPSTTQKSSRPTSAPAKKLPGSLSKKPASATSVSATVKKESRTAVSKTADRRQKTDKPTAAKPRSAPVASSKASSSVKASTVKSSKSSAVSSVAPKPGQGSSKTSAPAAATAVGKSDGKAMGSPGAKMTRVKSSKPATPSKVTERSKKAPSHVQKGKVDVGKPSPKSSPRVASKKNASKASSDKPKNKTPTPTPLLTNTTAPPADLTADFSKFERDVETAAKPAELPSASSEEPTTSVLSDRHSPEGEDGSTIQYPESNSITLNEKSDVDKQNLQPEDPEKKEEQEKETVDIIIRKPEISEDSDMISTNGSSAFALQQTPSEEAIIDANAVKLEDQFLSSDKSTPDDQQPDEDNTGKAISFDEPTDKGSHKMVARLPTPYHSIQESPTEGSPMSDNEGAIVGTVNDEAKPDMLNVEVQQSYDIVHEKDLDDVPPTGGQTDLDDGPSPLGQKDDDVLPQKEQIVYDTPLQVEQKDVIEGELLPTGADALPDNIQNDGTTELGSDIHSSFNSSIEGSYELCPTGRSPPASAQETIADTISEFKQDEPPAVTDLQDDPSTCFDAQPPQGDPEDQTVSVDAVDPRVSLSTASNGSQIARMDPPFSSSEASFSPKDSQLHTQQESAFESMPKFLMGSHRTEDDISSLCGCSSQLVNAAREEVQTHANYQLLQIRTAAELGAQGEMKNQQETVETELTNKQEVIDYTMDAEYADTDNQVQEGCDTALIDDDLEEDGEKEAHQDDADQGYDVIQDNQAALKEATWQDEDYAMLQNKMHEHEEAANGYEAIPGYHHTVSDMDQDKLEVGLPENEPLHSDEKDTMSVGARAACQPAGDQYEEGLHAVEDHTRDHASAEVESHTISVEKEQTQPPVYMEPTDSHEGFELHAPQIQFDQEQTPAVDIKPCYHEGSGEPVGGSDCHKQQMDKQMMQDEIRPEDGEGDFAGSRASSAQEQEPEDCSSSASVTESAPESELCHDDDACEDEGPNVEEYEQVESGVISKSELTLPTHEENFPLHGGNDRDHEQAMQREETQEEKPFYEPPTQLLTAGQMIVDTDAEPGDSASVGQRRYLPSYVDPSAPLADTEEVHTGIDHLKTIELESPLDVNAKPFIPKSSVPTDPPTAYETEEYLTQGDGGIHDSDTSGAAVLPSQGTTNPFLMDLMASSQHVQFDSESLQEPMLPPTRGPDACAAHEKNTKAAVKKSATGRKPASSPLSPVFVDLAYVPNHGNKNSVGSEFFKKIQSKYYVISGNNLSRDEPSVDVLNHLLQGRKSCLSEGGTNPSQEDSNVTVIPTHETPSVREWYKQNFKELELYNIHMVASGSKVLVQVESIEACKIEF